MSFPTEPATFSRKRHVSRKIWIVGLFTCILILLQVSQLFTLTTYAQTTHRATSYSCGNLSSNHCYANMYWPGGIQGEKTDILAEPINCGCDGFLNAELWVQASSGCAPNCWVEAGLKNETGYGSTFSFWADQRPGGGYHNHYNNGITQGDIGHSITFFIYKTGTNQWRVTKAHAGVNGCTSQCSADWTQYSTNNSMVANYITLGDELAGSSGASSPDIHFTWNFYYNNSSWYPQGAGNPGAGLVGAGLTPPPDDPPYAYWANGQVGGPTGGDLDTYCC
jgi:hypothetical protein